MALKNFENSMSLQVSQFRTHMYAVVACGHELRLSGHTYDDSLRAAVGASPTREVSTALKQPQFRPKHNFPDDIGSAAGRRAPHEFWPLHDAGVGVRWATPKR